MGLAEAGLILFSGHNSHDAGGLCRIAGVITAVLEIRGVVVDLDEDMGAGEFEGNEVVFLVGVVGVVEVFECLDALDEPVAGRFGQ